MTLPAYFVNASDFGVTPDGVTINTSALQTANDAVAAMGGGYLLLPAGVIVVDGTILNHGHDVKWLGAGAGRFHYSGSYITAATVLKWAGAVGGTMVKMSSDGTQTLAGCGVEGIYFDAGTGANTALYLVSHCSGEFSIVGGGFRGQMVILQVDESITENPADSQSNIFRRIIGNCAQTGGLLTLDGAPGQGNSSFNIVELIEGNYTDGHAVVLGNCDNNLINMARLYRNAGGRGLGVAVLGSAVANSSARSNVFRNLSTGAGGLYAQGTADVLYPAGDTYVEYLDAINGSFASGGAGAHLYVGKNNTPRSFT